MQFSLEKMGGILILQGVLQNLLTTTLKKEMRCDCTAHNLFVVNEKNPSRFQSKNGTVLACFSSGIKAYLLERKLILIVYRPPFDTRSWSLTISEMHHCTKKCFVKRLFCV